MKQLKINRNHFISLDNIKKLVIKTDCVWVYQKTGYPPILKTSYNLYSLKNKLVNLGKQLNDFKVEYI